MDVRTISIEIGIQDDYRTRIICKNPNRRRKEMRTLILNERIKTLEYVL